MWLLKLLTKHAVISVKATVLLLITHENFAKILLPAEICFTVQTRYGTPKDAKNSWKVSVDGCLNLQCGDKIYVRKIFKEQLIITVKIFIASF